MPSDTESSVCDTAELILTVYCSVVQKLRDDASFCEASMWLADVVSGAPAATAAKLWKSWTMHRVLQPTQVLHQTDYMHMLPTPATIQAQTDTRSLEGWNRFQNLRAG